MNIQNFRIEKEPVPSTDWRVYGDIFDDSGVQIGSFGPEGTSVNVWWVSQDADFQFNIVSQFAVIMAQQITQGTAE
jgi:hypothetical protein